MEAIRTVQTFDKNHTLKSDGIVYKQSKPLSREEGSKLIAQFRDKRVLPPRDRGRPPVVLDISHICRQHSPTPHPVSDGERYSTSVKDSKIKFTGRDNQDLKDTKVKNALWAMTTDRNFLVHHNSSTFKHNFFYTDYRGFGKSLLCAGHVDISKEGKIIRINNGSGHYRPNETHLRNVARYLSSQNLLAPDCQIHDSHHSRDLRI